MKTKSFVGCIILLIILTSTSAHATTYVFKTELSTSAMPIRLQINGDEYWFTSSGDKFTLELNGTYNCSCEDAYGQWLKIETARMDDGTVNVYIGGIMPSWSNHGKRRKWSYSNGTIIENSTGSSGDSYSNYDSSDSQDGYNDGYNYYSEKYGSPEENAEKAKKNLKKAAGFVGDLVSNGDKQFLIRGALSRAWGTYGRVEARFGGGVAFMIYGGVGKDFVWNLENKDKLSWHAGLGLALPLGDDGELTSPSDVSLGLTYGETPAYENKALLLELAFSHFFGSSRRFGLFASAGFGLGNFNEDIKEWFYDNRHYVWDVTAGIAIRIF
ncbi:MAG: hypothetical protein IJP59_08920 [Muribaculaceae bacterium]|nr:hypothetical protein [Muribaculaceae bacterium]